MSKGIYIPDITVEMFRNAPLEGVEELLVSGVMRDIEVGEDAISRKWLEKELSKYTDYDDDGEMEINADCVFITLKDAPSVIPSRPQGEWIELGQNKDGTHNICCGACGGKYKSKGHARSYYTSEKYKYCPNCGADMRGASNG